MLSIAINGNFFHTLFIVRIQIVSRINLIVATLNLFLSFCELNYEELIIMVVRFSNHILLTVILYKIGLKKKIVSNS